MYTSYRYTKEKWNSYKLSSVNHLSSHYSEHIPRVRSKQHYQLRNQNQHWRIWGVLDVCAPSSNPYTTAESCSDVECQRMESWQCCFRVNRFTKFLPSPTALTFPSLSCLRGILGASRYAGNVTGLYGDVTAFLHGGLQESLALG